MSSDHPLISVADRRITVRRSTRAVVLLFVWLIYLAGAAFPALDSSAQELAPRVVELTLEEIRVPSGGEVERAVRRLLPLRIGDPVDPNALTQIRESLNATPMLEEVQVYTARGKVPGAVILYVEAKFERGFRFETGLGRTPFRGWYLNYLGVRYASPFNRGGLVRLSFRQYLRSDGIYAEAEYPRVIGNEHDLLLDANLERDSWTIIEAPGADQRYFQQILRARLHLGIRSWIDPQTSASFWAGYSDAEPDDEIKESYTDEKIPVDGTFVPIPQGTERYLDTRIEVFRDLRDTVSPWQKGSWAGLKLNGSVQKDGAPFAGVEAQASKAIPMEKVGAFAVRGRAAYAGNGTPYHLRYIVGGTESLRGWPLAGLSGPLGARALWQLNTELRLPILGRETPRPRATQVVFFDVGDHWTGDGKQFGVSANVGFGLLIRLPWIQIFNTEVAFPLTGDTSSDPVVIHMSLGRSF